MTAERVHELLEDYVADPLSGQQVEHLLTYLDLLLKWNAKTNLTAIRDPEQIVRRHFGESLALAAETSRLGVAGDAADVGSGAGFPGIPLALYAPQLRVTLIESQNKKATFLKEVVRALGLNNVSVLNQRAEEVRIQCDLVTMRAVERFTQALIVGSLLLKQGGHLALLVSSQQAPEVKMVLAHRNMRWQERTLPENARVLIGQL